MASTLWAEEFSKCTQVVSNAKPNQMDSGQVVADQKRASRRSVRQRHLTAPRFAEADLN